VTIKQPRVPVDRFADLLGPGAVRTGEAAGREFYADESLRAAAVEPAVVLTPANTSEVAEVVRIAATEGWPVTARGAGTGLSGACIPVEGGIVVSFERMADIVEVDLENQVAVVQPGVTLAQLNERLAPTGLVYPVFPGTDSASLGGNAATNAGGMRAVKYGVTRHHVLGLEAVLGTGEVISTGGRYVKTSTGYDLTQLIVGSEGTLALVTEVTVRLHPLLPSTTALLAPFSAIDEVAAVVPRIVASGLQPLVLEYIDKGTMKGLLRMTGMNLGLSATVIGQTEAYLVVVLEGKEESRVEQDCAALATQLYEAGAQDAFYLPPGQAADLLAARENAFWMVKAAGADDLVDMVVPRSRIPEYLRRVQELAKQFGSRVYGCGHAGDGNIHFSVYEPDEQQRSALLSAIYSMGARLGGAISGEHGIGRSKRQYYMDIESPEKLALQRRIKAAFDPAGILNPGCIFTAQTQ
jgi:glycolate oxidase